MQEIILYAILTLIVGGMLYAVLGRNVGVGQDKPLDPLAHFKDLNGADKPAPAHQFSGPFAETMADIAALDKSFNPDKFLDQAQTAYGMILDAYAEGDRALLADLLTDEVRESYFAAIEDREAKNLTQLTDLARIIEAKIANVEKNKSLARISVEFFSELATALTDTDGNVVQGDPDLLARVREIWIFERDLKSKNPNWRLAGVEPHTTSAPSDTPDHSPDTH